MAGSAINLSGMLSQMNESLGRMGNTVGEGMFNPLLEVQKERAAQKEQERLKAEAAAKVKGHTAAVIDADNAVISETNDPSSDGRALEAQIKRMEQGALDNPEMAPEYLAKAAELRQHRAGLDVRGAIRGISAINKTLANPSTTADQRKALSERLEVLMAKPGVKEELAKINKSVRAGRIQELELRNKQHEERGHIISQKAHNAADLLLSGATVEQIRQRFPNVESEVLTKAQKIATEGLEAKQRYQDIQTSQTDNSEMYSGTKWEKIYKDTLLKYGAKRANKVVGEAEFNETLTSIQERRKADKELDKLTGESRIRAILNTSNTQWKFWGEDFQEAFADLDTGDQDEAISRATGIYYNMLEQGQDRDVATAVALDSIAREIGEEYTPDKETQEKIDQLRRDEIRRETELARQQKLNRLESIREELQRRNAGNVNRGPGGRGARTP